MSKVKLIVMDVDGTLTDGKIYMGDMGESVKAFDTKDGYALYELLPRNDILPVIITGRTSKIVERRCNELGIKEIYQGCLDKKKKLMEIAVQRGLACKEDEVIQGCAYIGDDILDIPGMKMSEVAGCPADAVADVQEIATYICKRKGGEGAVREFIEWIIKNY